MKRMVVLGPVEEAERTDYVRKIIPGPVRAMRPGLGMDLTESKTYVFKTREVRVSKMVPFGDIMVAKDPEWMMRETARELAEQAGGVMAEVSVVEDFAGHGKIIVASLAFAIGIPANIKSRAIYRFVVSDVSAICSRRIS